MLWLKSVWILYFFRDILPQKKDKIASWMKKIFENVLCF